MAFKNKRRIFTFLFLFIAGAFFISAIASCGKSGNASPKSLNVQYRVFNLSPDVAGLNLFINFQQVNSLNNPFIYNVDHGYFYLPSLDTPFQFRSALTAGTPILALNRKDILTSGAKYSVFITGAVVDNTLTTIFTVDTATSPIIGRGKLRFVNASPTGTTGLDVNVNGTQAFSDIIYTKFSNYVELPVGNYDIQINTTGASNVLKDIPGVTIQDGRLYTLYAYGYTTRIDSAQFNAAVYINR